MRVPSKRGRITRLTIKGALHLSLVWLIVLTSWQVGEGRQGDTATIQQDIKALKRDVSALSEKQQQIIDQLSELKRLLQANSETRGAVHVPTSIVLHGELFKGAISAQVAIIEYGDFECPFCGQFMREVYPQIISKYISTVKVKYFYRDLAMPMHPHALSAARAARCAGEQGKLWEMRESLFANQAALADKDLSSRAQELGLDTGKFVECVSSERYTEDIRRSFSEAQKMGIGGTPTFLLGIVESDGQTVRIEKTIIGAYPYEVFQSDLEELLADSSRHREPGRTPGTDGTYAAGARRQLH
jgi:protein-disulfide isomerase